MVLNKKKNYWKMKIIWLNIINNLNLWLQHRNRTWKKWPIQQNTIVRRHSYYLLINPKFTGMSAWPYRSCRRLPFSSCRYCDVAADAVLLHIIFLLYHKEKERERSRFVCWRKKKGDERESEFFFGCREWAVVKSKERTSVHHHGFEDG